MAYSKLLIVFASVAIFLICSSSAGPASTTPSPVVCGNSSGILDRVYNWYHGECNDHSHPTTTPPPSKLPPNQESSGSGYGMSAFGYGSPHESGFGSGMSGMGEVRHKRQAGGNSYGAGTTPSEKSTTMASSGESTTAASSGNGTMEHHENHNATDHAGNETAAHSASTMAPKSTYEGSISTTTVASSTGPNYGAVRNKREVPVQGYDTTVHGYDVPVADHQNATIETANATETVTATTPANYRHKRQAPEQGYGSDVEPDHDADDFEYASTGKDNATTPAPRYRRQAPNFPRYNNITAATTPASQDTTGSAETVDTTAGTVNATTETANATAAASASNGTAHGSNGTAAYPSQSNATSPQPTTSTSASTSSSIYSDNGCIQRYYCERSCHATIYAASGSRPPVGGCPQEAADAAAYGSQAAVRDGNCDYCRQNYPLCTDALLATYNPQGSSSLPSPPAPASGNQTSASGNSTSAPANQTSASANQTSVPANPSYIQPIQSYNQQPMQGNQQSGQGNQQPGQGNQPPAQGYQYQYPIPNRPPYGN